MGSRLLRNGVSKTATSWQPFPPASPERDKWQGNPDGDENGHGNCSRINVKLQTAVPGAGATKLSYAAAFTANSTPIPVLRGFVSQASCPWDQPRSLLIQAGVFSINPPPKLVLVDFP